MIFSSVFRRGVRVATPIARNASTTTTSKGAGIPPGVLRSWYNIFGKTNAGYITWIVGGVLVTELVTGAGIDAMWGSVNSGRTYHSVDWEKFKVEDDDDDDDDDDDEDDDEEEEGEGEGDDDDEDDDDE
eukprot:148163_1